MERHRLIELQNVLADLYQEENDAKRIAKEAGLDLKYIEFSRKAISNWDSILDVAKKQNRIQTIVDIAYNQYPDNEPLNQFINQPHLTNGMSPSLEERLDSLAPIANLSDEMSAFIDILHKPPKRTRPILLIKADSGKGKSTLVLQYKEYCKSLIPVAHIDLKGGWYDPVRIMNRIIRDFKNYDLNFPRCEEVLPSSSLNIPLDRQKQLWSGAIDELQRDLDNLTDIPKPLVLILDTYEMAAQGTQKWISEELLTLAIPYRIINLVIIIAGQEIPDPPGECQSHCQVLQLRPPKLENWIVYSQQVDSRLNPDLLSRLYQKHGDNPLRMTQTILDFV